MSNYSRLELLQQHLFNLTSMLGELGTDDTAGSIMPSEDRAALIDWMIEEKVEMLNAATMRDDLRNIYYSGCKGYSEMADLELLDEYVGAVSWVPDSDFEGFGQLLRCEKVIKDKIAEIILLNKG